MRPIDRHRARIAIGARDDVKKNRYKIQLYFNGGSVHAFALSNSVSVVSALTHTQSSNPQPHKQESINVHKTATWTIEKS